MAASGAPAKRRAVFPSGPTSLRVRRSDDAGLASLPARAPFPGS
ncbi:hypothetical protein HMPREF0972_00275 [Actinomyces sp. oral taxon 848 str. F0332]|nr:hypothetical protein HMPREF0972_00275 [Actinomyces sp. oral taxon 848 str. F0332]